MEMEIRFPGGMRVDAETSGHTVATDQAICDGGSGTAPNPFELFVASIGACTGYYILAFCRKREIPTEEIHLHLTAERDEAARRLTSIRIRVELPASFPERYVDACVHAASQCTVKKHLETPPSVTIEAHRI